MSFYPDKVTGNLWRDPNWSFNSRPNSKTGLTTDKLPTWWAIGYDPSETTRFNTWIVTFNCCCVGARAHFKDDAPGYPVEYDGGE